MYISEYMCNLDRTVTGNLEDGLILWLRDGVKPGLLFAFEVSHKHHLDNF